MNTLHIPALRHLRTVGIAITLGAVLFASGASGADAGLVLTATPGTVLSNTRQTHHVGDFIRVGARGALQEHETCGDAVIIGNSATIRGQVQGDLVVVGGSADVYNRVDGDLVLVGGSATLSPAVSIGGELVNIGGTINAPEDIQVGGQRVEIAPFLGSILSTGRTYAKLCLLKGRLVSELLPWTIAVLGALTLLGFLLSMLFPATFGTAARIAADKPGIALIAGVLTALAAGPVIIALLATVIGIPAVPVLMIMLIGLVFIGTTGVYAAIGRQFLKVFTGREVNAFIPALTGAAITIGLAMVPWIGAMVLFIVFTFGTGAGVYGFIDRIKSGRTARKQSDTVAPPSAAVSAPQLPVEQTPAATVTAPATPVPHSSPIPEPESETPAGMWPRLGAACIDILLVFLIYGVSIGAILGSFDHPGQFSHAQGGLHILCLMIYLSTLWVWKGTTVGNIIFHLQVRRTDNSRLTIGVAVIRALGLLLSLAPLGLGFFWINWDANRQAWHDKIAGTKVVRIPKGVPLV